MTKKNVDKVGSFQGYLVVYFFFSLISAFLITPELFKTAVSSKMFTTGCITGVFTGISMILLPMALRYGPAGLTFSFQNASSVLPAVLLFFIFGSAYGFIMTPYIILGILCVLIGLFLSARTKNDSEATLNTNYSLKKWLILILSTFALQAVILSIYHWKSLIVNNELFSHPLIFIHCFKEEDIWFAPGLFFSALILNVVIFIFKEKRGLYKSEMLYGTIAGLFNGGSTFLLLLATNISTSTEKGMLFPAFAVCVILFCSLWSKKLYKEKINWIAISLCIVGVILGSL